MNIQLQNTQFFPAVGGIESYLYYASKTLLKLNHKPTILCSRHLPNLHRADTYENIRVIRHPPYFPLSAATLLHPFARALHPFYYVGKLQGFIKTNVRDVDVVWARHPYYCYSSCKALQVPVIYILAAVWPLALRLLHSMEGMRVMEKLYVRARNHIKSLQDSFIEEKALQACNKIVVFSKIMGRHVIDYYGISSKKIRVIPPGVDLKGFHMREKDEALLEELKVPRKAGVVLTVTRLVPRKNIQMMIEALARFHRRDVYLVIVGDGAQRQRLEKLTEDLGLASRVRFVGFRSDVERFYSIADVFVLPSRYEPFGHVFLEAMASGVPCIGLKMSYPKVITACDEIIDDGKTGYISEPLTRDLKTKIEKIISDVDLKEKMGREARKTCEAKYS